MPGLPDYGTIMPGSCKYPSDLPFSLDILFRSVYLYISATTFHPLIIHPTIQLLYTKQYFKIHNVYAAWIAFFLCIYLPKCGRNINFPF